MSAQPLSARVRRAVALALVALACAGCEEETGGRTGRPAAGPVAATAACSGGAVPAGRPTPQRTPPYAFQTIAARDATPPIDIPVFWTAAQGAPHYEADEAVVGVALANEARAYPIRVLSRHEIVNDTVAQTPISVTWCPRCHTAIVFARPGSGGRILDFGVSGKLVMNCLVMYDRQTNTLWSQPLGRAIWGPLAGTDLATIPALLTTWAAWRDLYPDTAVLTLDQDRPDPYAGYYRSPNAGLFGADHPDARLPAKALVTGLVVDGQAMAYPWEALATQRVINDEVAGRPVLVAHDPRRRTTFVFDRQVEGSALTFEVAAPLAGRLAIREVETGLAWDVWVGWAAGGRFADRGLTPLPSTSAFWFAWRDFHPDTGVYQAPDTPGA